MHLSIFVEESNRMVTTGYLFWDLLSIGIYLSLFLIAWGSGVIQLTIDK